MSRGWSRALLVVGVLAVLGWAVPALLMAGKGLAIEDEGTYVLSYRWWSSDLYAVSGSQYFYGPIYDLFGGSIPALRVLRVVMAVGVNAWVGWAITAWLRARTGAPTGPGRAAVTALVTAAGGLTYLWSPLTPGYYDLTAACSLGLVAVSLQLLARDGRGAMWAGLLAGPLSFALVFTKWPAVLVVLLVVGVTASVLRRAGHCWHRYLLGWLLGLLLIALVVQLVVVPLGPAVRGLAEGLSMSSGHGLGRLVPQYLRNTRDFGLGALVFALPSLATYAGALRWRTGSARARAAVVVAGAVVTGVVLPFPLGWRGGAALGAMATTVALAALTAGLLTSLFPRPDHRLPEARPVGVLLLGVPLLAAAGTNVPLPYVIAECLSLWAALALMLAARRRAPEGLPHLAVTANLAALGVMVAMLAGSTTLLDPFKTTGYSDDTVHVDALGLDLSPEVAGQYAALQRALSPYVERGRTPVVSLDQAAGLTYLLDGVPVGSTWTDYTSFARTAHLIDLACRRGDVPTSHPPVFVVDRPVDDVLAAAVGRCGWRFPDDFRRLAVPGGPPDFTVWVPRG